MGEQSVCDLLMKQLQELAVRYVEEECAFQAALKSGLAANQKASWEGELGQMVAVARAHVEAILDIAPWPSTSHDARIATLLRELPEAFLTESAKEHLECVGKDAAR